MTELKKVTILLVEDEADLRRETAAFLSLYYEQVIQAANGAEALTLFSRHKPDLVISDIRMPVMDGIELATHLREKAPGFPLIFCTAFTETSYLLKAVDLGVAAFVRKPANTDDLLTAIDRATLPLMQRREIEGLSSELSATMLIQLGSSPQQRAATQQATRVAQTSFSVLLRGETGSGKSRLASIIHALSPRREAPFVTVQLGAMPENLAESELFGHLKGAFTGADRDRLGLVEKARGGTLFLDDIDACPASVQAKLLRFAELKSYTPVGSTTEKSVDVRIIAASNRDMREEVKAGRFREDLYYRLADVTIPIPALRETRDAIVPLALKFLRETCDELGCDQLLLGEEARQLLVEEPWPGNVRQLKSVIRRTALNAVATINKHDVAQALDGPSSVLPENEIPFALSVCSPPPFPCDMDSLEKWSIERALTYCGGKRMKTAAMLGMNYYTFRRRLEKHGITLGEE